MTVDSAIPSELTGFSSWAQQQDRELLSVAGKINDAIEHFNATAQNPQYVGPLPYVGNDVASLSGGMSAV